MWIGPEDHKRVGERLAAARKRAGMTQRELAAKLGKPQSFVSSYENGQRRVDLLEFEKIAGALGATPGRLFAIVIRKGP